jgi:hypothetical protein
MAVSLDTFLYYFKRSMVKGLKIFEVVYRGSYFIGEYSDLVIAKVGDQLKVKSGEETVFVSSSAVREALGNLPWVLKWFRPEEYVVDAKIKKLSSSTIPKFLERGFLDQRNQATWISGIDSDGEFKKNDGASKMARIYGEEGHVETEVCTLYCGIIIRNIFGPVRAGTNGN